MKKLKIKPSVLAVLAIVTVFCIIAAIVYAVIERVAPDHRLLELGRAARRQARLVEVVERDLEDFGGLAGGHRSGGSSERMYAVAIVSYGNGASPTGPRTA